MRFLATCLPQAPDDLESGVGLAGAGGHDEEDPVLPLGNGFDGLVDGDALIVTRLLATAVLEVVLEEDFLLLRGQAFPCTVFRPKVFGCREGVEGQLGFGLTALAGAVVEKERVTV